MILHSVLMIGQSNMAGRGDLSEAPALDNKNLFVLKNGRWQPLFRPVCPDRPFSGVSLAESFAAAYRDKFGVSVGLIPCADGGSCIDEWQCGSLLFDNAVYGAQLASRTSTIAAVIWHQGESDCSDKRYPDYKSKLKALIYALREYPELKDAPFIIGGIGDFLSECVYKPNDFANSAYINAALRQVTAEVSGCAFADAANLKSKPDGLHFNTEACLEFGLRYFDAFLSVYDAKRVFEDKPDPVSALRNGLEKL